MTLNHRGRRRKGHQFERDLARIFRDVFPGHSVKRGLQSRMGGGFGKVPDVDVPCFWVEAKRGKKPNHRAALAQAVADCEPGKTPIAVVKDDQKPATVTMLLDDFCELVRDWWRLSNA